MKTTDSNVGQNARRSPCDSTAEAAVKPTARSQVTNGTRLLVGVDGRSREARRWRDTYADFMARTRGQHEQLCRALASMVVRREQLDAAIARGECVDALDLVRLCGAINRTMARCGLVSESDVATPTDMTAEAIRLMQEAAP